MKNINLLPSENKKNNKEKMLIKKMITVEVIIFFVLILFVTTSNVANRIISEKIILAENLISKKLNATNNIKEELQIAETKNNDLNEIRKYILKDQDNIEYFITAITKQIPSQVFILNLNLESSEKSLYLECISEKSDGSSEFIKRLNNTGTFEEISLLAIEINNANYELFSLGLKYGEIQNE